jgi:methylated-DNA-[protein]-cysteine S-methyltransferase
MESPLGPLRLVAGARGLVAVLWPRESGARTRATLSLGACETAPHHPVLHEAARQLSQYFAGGLRRFDLPLEFRGTAFQNRVWAALLSIPWGETRSYAQLARQIGHPEASRAVGAANGRNPLSIIAPCHRVLGSTGALTGFAGGLPAKAFLLRLEGTLL